MRCFFLRHGIAAEPQDWQGSDFERPLTESGRKRMAREAEVIGTLELDLDLIVSSPLVRARETASIVAKALKLADKLIEDERLGPAFDLARLQSILRDHPKARSILLVGHEPGMSQTVGRLTGGSLIDFKKGALARVDMGDGDPARGLLVWLIPPKLLAS
jgi:phosphohistidine phosphatase